MNTAAVKSRHPKFYWSSSELVAIGVFAALIRIVGLAITLAGGGMNPFALILRNAVSAGLLIVLLHKSPRSGTLSLYVLIYAMFSVLLMGSGMMTLPGTMLATGLVDLLFAFVGGYNSTKKILLAVILSDILMRASSLAVGYISVRENPAMFYVAAVIVAIAFVGTVLGLFIGKFFVKELRAAGIIRK